MDELLSLTDRRHPPNWLLTYIDVFVLIVMLVVTLVALSSFEPASSQPAPVEQSVSPPPKPIVVAAPERNTSEPIAIEPVETETQPDISNAPPDNVPLAAETPSAIGNLEEPSIPEEAQQAEPNHEPTEALEQTEPVTPTAIPEHEIQQQLQQQLEQLGLSDNINTSVTQGYAQLEIQDNILYQSSEAALTESGRAVLAKLTPLLKQAKGLIYIEGHTDNRPIKTSQFPSNWELGAARATSVLHFLTSQQIDAARLRAVTYADTKPIADNTTEQGRQKNRRVNIIIKVSDDVD